MKFEFLLFKKFGWGKGELTFAIIVRNFMYKIIFGITEIKISLIIF